MRQPGLVRAPLQDITEDYSLVEHPYLAFTTRSFLQGLRPAVEYGWAVLEEDPTDYAYNEAKLGLNKVEIDQAVATCLDNTNQFEGLAKFVALFYKAKRCVEGQKLTWLQQAQAQAERLLDAETSGFMSELFLFKLGRFYYHIGCWRECIFCCDKALAINPKFHEAFYGRGIALSAVGHYEEEVVCYDRALALKPDYYQALHNKGVALSDLGNKAGAIACYDAALAIKHDYTQAFYSKGNLLADSGNLVEAIAC